MYLAVDIETTGLNPEQDQVLEIACVLDQQELPVMECPTFRRIVRHDRVSGSPSALEMNRDLLRAIADGEGNSPITVTDRLTDWLMSRNPAALNHGTTMLGKNVGSFDWQFLKRMPSFPTAFFSHRFLDVGSMFSTHDMVPGQSALEHELEELLNHIPGEEHEALHDARVSLTLARHHWGIPL